MELLKKTAVEQHKALVNKEVSALELTKASIERIEKLDKELGCFNSTTFDSAIETAKKVDEKIAAGEEIPMLAGIPTALKDNMNYIGSKTTCSSKMLENFVSPYDATITTKLKENLVPILGKANLDEFAMGSSNENSAFGIVRNPYNLSKVPGGSSGGSAASVASSEVTLSLGSDTGGSIRLPASFCGITGFKPTYGRVSRYGLIAFASSLDQIGPFGKSIEDITLLYEAIAGYDSKDSTSLKLEVGDIYNNLKKDIKGLRVGVIKELMSEGVSDDVKASIENSIKTYEKMGAEIKEISLPLLKHSIGVYYIVATAEASSNLARFDGVKYGFRAADCENLMDMYCKTRAQGFGPEVKRRIMLGTYALSSGYYDAYYKKAQQLRRLIADDFNKAFESVDILVSPTCPTTAFDLNSKANNPLEMYLTDIATISSNLVGAPALSMPCGFDKDGMPIGVQIIAKNLNELTLLQASFALEQELEVYTQRPNI
ncbi:MAG: Asp-tRNA(Asn)/Glu-tRNA(Gln) amidotransferase subunit GatA [Candidatus Gastranaerophilales bacterium]|nr:Asp-tRNA(Asn)/Glu-tRNA(Gln) amidotransferase subunit GatA [Candidatus Gastranaerophilales bacterium]